MKGCFNIMKFNLGELETLFEKINDFINYLELIKLENKSFLLFLSYFKALFI